MPATAATIAKVFANPQAFSSSLAIAALEAFGSEYLSWTLRTVVSEIGEDYLVSLSPTRQIRLGAGMSLLSSDAFWSDLPSFLIIANAVNGAGYNPNIWDPVDCMEAAWALTEAILLEHLVIDSKKTDHISLLRLDIKQYIAAAADDEGLVNLPDVLQAAVPDEMSRAKQRMIGWTQEPDVYQAIIETENRKTAAIKAEIKSRLRLLLQQISDLLSMKLSDLIEHCQFMEI